MSCFAVFCFLIEATASLQAEAGNLICDLLLDKEWREIGTGEVAVCDKTIRLVFQGYVLDSH